MKYKGIELKEFTSDKPVAFDPPKKMLVWDDDDRMCRCAVVLAYLPEGTSPVIVDRSFWQYCAEIPEETKELKPRRATNLELTTWLAKGNGLCWNVRGSLIWTTYEFDMDIASCACGENIRIRKWGDEEWHEPTVDYMGLED
jgi:hypothetical protein